MKFEDSWRAPLVRASVNSILAIGAVALTAACTSTSISEQVPSGAAAYDALPSGEGVDPASGYQIGAYDVLQISTLNEPDLTFDNVPVDAAGQFSFPFIGSIPAGGMTTSGLERFIKDRLDARYTRDAQVTIFVKSAASQIFTVEGDVEKPGTFQYGGPTTLMTAIARAGSPTDTAKLDEVAVFRVVNGERFGAAFNLNDIREGRVPDPTIYPGDTIFVGYSSIKQGFEKFLRLAPIFNIFTRF